MKQHWSVIVLAALISTLGPGCAGAPPDPDAGTGGGEATGGGAAGGGAAGGGQGGGSAGGQGGGSAGGQGGGSAGGQGGGGGTAGGTGGGAADRFLLVATSYVPRLINLTTGATVEAHGDKLRWVQNPGHLYQHFDVSPDGAQLVIYHGDGTNAPTSSDRLVLYTLDGSLPPRSLAKNTGSIGQFTTAPCFRADGKVLVIAQGAIWALDSTLDDTQVAVKVADVNPASALSTPIYWNRDCSRFIANAFRGGSTNTSSTNVGLGEASTGALTQLTEHAIGQKTLAQQANFPGCTGTGCVVAKSGGTIGAMGWLPGGAIYLKSNRDMWRDSASAFQGAEKIFTYDPASPKTFDQLDEWAGAKPHAISRDGAYYAVVNGNASTVEVYRADGTLLIASEAVFNAANAPGFMRFIP